MKCLVCNKLFIIKRSIKTLLELQKYLICNECYKANPIKLNKSTIPLDNQKNAFIISLFLDNSYVNYKAFILEYSNIAIYYINYYLLLYDVFNICKKTINDLNYISKLVDDDVYVLCFRCRLV